MHFWRNKSGIEVDLLIGFEKRMQALEFKAGKTVAIDWFCSLRRYAELMMKNGGSDLIQTLVYGGEATHTRPNVQIVGWLVWAEELTKRYASDITDPLIEEAVIKLATEQLGLGRARISNEACKGRTSTYS
jgi:hypothetical protein